jgi:hypothetical protein
VIAFLTKSEKITFRRQHSLSIIAQSASVSRNDFISVLFGWCFFNGYDLQKAMIDIYQVDTPEIQVSDILS